MKNSNWGFLSDSTRAIWRAPGLQSSSDQLGNCGPDTRVSHKNGHQTHAKQQPRWVLTDAKHRASGASRHSYEQAVSSEHFLCVESSHSSNPLCWRTAISEDFEELDTTNDLFTT